MSEGRAGARVKSRWVSTGIACALAGCAQAPYEERVVGAGEGRDPFGYARVVLPAGSRAVAAWASPEGGGVAALEDGRFVQVDRAGGARSIDRLPSESPRAGDAPAAMIRARGAGNELLAVVPAGALLVQNGLYRGAQLPAFLAGVRAFTPWLGEALWAAGDGLYASDGARWVRLDDGAGAVRNATSLAVFTGPSPGEGREAWVVSGGALRRVRYAPGTGGAPATVAWVELPATLTARMGTVREVAAMSPVSGAASGERGLAVFGPFGVRFFERAQRDGVSPPGPAALGAGGGWAWVLWNGDVMRTDGDRFETLATGVAEGDRARVAVDEASGASAAVVDQNGALLLIDAAETLRVSGFSDAVTVFDPRLELEAVESPRQHFENVRYFLDGDETTPLAERTSAPWGWGPEGARALELPRVAFGAHQVVVVARNNEGRELRRTLRFAYASPLGRVPSYMADVAPIYEARCARCHSNGVALDLTGLEGMRRAAPIVRQTLRERRMPPDLLLDPTAAAVITAWIDGETPP